MNARQHGPHKRRLLFIGLDAGDRELIEHWCDEGLLRNISRMRSTGIWTQLHTTADIVHVSAWPSIFTGTSPDKHGLYHAYVMQPGQQAPVRPRPDLCPVPFLWKLLDEHGKRCIVMDAFLTCPLQQFDGVQIVDWGSWTWFWKPTILPASLQSKIAKKFGPYPAENHSKVGMTPPQDHRGFRDRLLAGVQKKTEVVKWLMDTEEWDFFLAVFGECHPAGHYFWHFQDPSYIAHPENCEKELRCALLDVYIALDQAIGELLDRADENTTVLLVSGDGMGPNYSGSHILEDLLARMKLLNDTGDSEPHSDADTQPTPRGAKDLSNTIRNLIPKSVRASISKNLLPRSINEKLSLRWKTAGIAWDRTKAFIIENANEGFIRINLKGREPEGTVEQGQEYQHLCDTLHRVAKNMVNPTNGHRATSNVYKTDDIYTGPCRSHMPDVIISWDPEAEVTTQLQTDDYGLAASDKPASEVSPYYTGNHRPNAFTAVQAPYILGSQVPEDASTLDLAPTILAFFGIEPPPHMDGVVLQALKPPSDS